VQLHRSSYNSSQIVVSHVNAIEPFARWSWFALLLDTQNDIFRYTADTNAALVWLLRHLGPMYTALGQVAKAKEMAKLAESVSAAMNQKLWHAESNDHYVTSS